VGYYCYNMDGRKFNKGTVGNKGGGRPPKSPDLELIEKLTPVNDLAYEKLKEGIARGEFKYIQLFFQYYYGKPKEKKDISLRQDTPLFID